jgi:hypothetical protein
LAPRFVSRRLHTLKRRSDESVRKDASWEITDVALGSASVSASTSLKRLIAPDSREKFPNTGARLVSN